MSQLIKNKIEHDIVIQSNSISNFLFALKAPESRRQYPRRLKFFFDFGLDKDLVLERQADLFIEKTNKQKNGIQWATQYFIQFLNYQKERVQRGDISQSTIPNYYKAAKLFCVMNDLILNWEKIGKGVPYEKKAADDRPPTFEEIEKLLEYHDKRIKPIILIMVSSGIRLGAFDYLRWKHVRPITDIDGKIVAARIEVYATDEEHYFSFITPEAHESLLSWMNYRMEHGEKITGESWVIRDIWQTSERSYGAYYGLAKNPKQLNSKGIKSLIERAIHSQGLWKPLNGKKRREWKGAHGFRKYFKTQAEQVMKSINVEILMGHNIGVSKSYYKPSEKEILDDYLKAVNILTFSDRDSDELKGQIRELKNSNEHNEYLIQVKLKEREDALNTLSDQFMQLQADVAMLKKQKAVIQKRSD
jgi:hypothetical protein